jgi:hypothetical protein
LAFSDFFTKIGHGSNRSKSKLDGSVFSQQYCKGACLYTIMPSKVIAVGTE